MSPLISTIISSLVPIFTDKLSKTAGASTVLYAIHLGITKLAETYLPIFPPGTTVEQLSYGSWGVIALVLVITPSEWLLGKMKVVKYLMEQLGKTR